MRTYKHMRLSNMSVCTSLLMVSREGRRREGTDDAALVPTSFADGRTLNGTNEYFRESHYIGALSPFSTTFSNHFELPLSSQ